MQLKLKKITQNQYITDYASELSFSWKLEKTCTCNSFKMSDVETFEVGANKPPDNIWTALCIWMKFCMEVMTLKAILMPYYLIS
jgi:hypothetical protein